jgi:hypothetical protein
MLLTDVQWEQNPGSNRNCWPFRKGRLFQHGISKRSLDAVWFWLILRFFICQSLLIRRGHVHVQEKGFAFALGKLWVLQNLRIE